MGIPVLFWDVDTQHDFIDPEGALPAPGAEEILPNLRRLTEFAARKGIPIVASADAHPEGDPEFDEFGSHCIPGTPGQRKVPESIAPVSQVADEQSLDGQIEALRAGRLAQLVIEKTTLDVFAEPAAGRVLAALSPERVIVYGVAIEYCVRVEALRILKAGHVVTVVEDAIRAIADKAGRKAIEELRQAGASFARTDEVLAALG
jgi:nicotinamidase/pyrazinamidase